MRESESPQPEKRVPRDKYAADPIVPDRTVPQDRYDLPEKALGGADAVPDTNYVPTAEPEHRKGEGGPVLARGAAAGGGQNTTWAIIVFLLVAAVLVYLLGFGR